MSVRAKRQTPSLAPASHVTLAGGLFLWVPGPCLLGDTVMCSPPRVVGRCYTPDRLSSQPGVHEKLKKCCEMSSPSPDVFLSIITMVIMMGKAGGIRRAPKKKKKKEPEERRKGERGEAGEKGKDAGSFGERRDLRQRKEAAEARHLGRGFRAGSQTTVHCCAVWSWGKHCPSLSRGFRVCKRINQRPREHAVGT